MQRGLLAEFDSPEGAARAIGKLKQRGLTRICAYMPYPDKQLQDALELRPSPLLRIVFGAGALGAALGYLILWYTNVIDFPINVGGHPDHAVPAFIPISFETLVLFAGVSAFLGALLLPGLPRLYHPVDELEGFDRVSVDRFVLGVDAEKDAFEPGAVETLFQELGALRVHTLGNLGPTAEEQRDGT